MAIKHGQKRIKQNTVMYTIITAIVLCVAFLGMIVFLYNKAKDEAYENLHIQTKQIKDNLILQLQSDNENLITMAGFAAKLNAEGMDYSIMLDSFKPIGLFSRIGILTPDCIFITKDETIDLSDKLSFEDEALLGDYITGRTYSYSRPDEEIIRSAVPIVADGKTVGIIYGTIKIDTISQRYKQMADDIDAQLFIYEKDSGNMIIDTIQGDLDDISFLKDRKYESGYSYEQFASTDKGFTAFKSKYKKETLHLHYSTIDELGWKIAMGRYDSQVFASLHSTTKNLFYVFFFMLGVITLYIIIIMTRERKRNAIIECASNIRKELLKITDGQNNIQDALIEICKFSRSRSALFFDTDSAFYHHLSPGHEETILTDKERHYFISELFLYVSEFHKNNNNVVNILQIKPDGRMQKINPSFFSFLKEHTIKEISLSATISKTNHITVLAVINPKHGTAAGILTEKVSACFSIALYNKNHLDKTTLAATTDPLTGVFNRVAYKNDLATFDNEKPMNFSCIYFDVNELHICNNKYGHVAGDEMLLYIANTLKEVFFGHPVYRMGGDEFLVFCRNTDPVEIKRNIELFNNQLKSRNYHVAIGVSFRSRNTGTEEMVREAELRMYESKAEYYQNKEQSGTPLSKEGEYVQIETGILEIDTLLSVMKEKYNGIYRVSLSTDKARRILMPAYLHYNENEENFSKLFSKYVAESVAPDYHRSVLSFLNYEALNRQLSENRIPKISFKKITGELVELSVYKLCDLSKTLCDTLWVFAKK